MKTRMMRSITILALFMLAIVPIAGAAPNAVPAAAEGLNPEFAGQYR